METTTFGRLEARVVGGTDRRGGGDGPVVVLLHGFGAPGDDLVALHRVLPAPAGTRFVFPVAPLSLGSPFPGLDARAWWPIDVAALERAIQRGELRDLTREEPDGLADARAAVDALLDEVAARLAPSALVLGGFSQGAMLSTDVALRSRRDLAGLCLFSGSYLAARAWDPRFADRAGLPVFQSHGRQDPILPFSLAEQLRARLETAGLPVDWCPFDGPHTIPPEAMDRAGAFLSRVLAPGDAP